MNGHGEFFLPFSSPKTAFLQVMDTNKKIITHRKRWRREDFSLCDELNWERRTFLQRKTPNWTAFSAIVCFVLLRYCIDIVYMVLDYYSKSKQTQSNTNTHCVLCVIKICVCVVWWNFWSCMAMELFYDRRIPRDCSVMNIWCIKRIKQVKHQVEWLLQKVENVHMDVWKSVTMCKASFINTVKNYTAVKTYIPGLRIRMFLYHRIKQSRLHW